VSVKYISARCDYAVTNNPIDGSWDIRKVIASRGEDKWDIVANRDTVKDAKLEAERRSDREKQEGVSFP
jgi:hypothetical protein